MLMVRMLYVCRIRATAAADPSGRPIPIAAVVTPSSVLGIEQGTFALPPEVDWIGFDNYGCWAQHECEQLGKCCWKNRTRCHTTSAYSLLTPTSAAVEWWWYQMQSTTLPTQADVGRQGSPNACALLRSSSSRRQ
eukprot:COSAG01_NODE_5353_length_4315_cov_32.988852_3_plen_135_part_00